MVGRKVRDATEAEELLDAVAASGQARAHWARQNGIDARSLNMWRLVLARRQRRPVDLDLVELVPMARRPSNEAIVVRCGPFAVEVGGQFDDEVLVRVFAAVAASC